MAAILPVELKVGETVDLEFKKYGVALALAPLNGHLQEVPQYAGANYCSEYIIAGHQAGIPKIYCLVLRVDPKRTRLCLTNKSISCRRRLVFLIDGVSYFAVIAALMHFRLLDIHRNSTSTRP